MTDVLKSNMEELKSIADTRSVVSEAKSNMTGKTT